MTGGIFIHFFKKERTRNEEIIYQSANEWQMQTRRFLQSRRVATKAAEELLREPVEVIDSFFQSAPVGAKPLWFIGKSLEFLSDADIAYFAKDWQKARGMQDRT